MILVTHTDRSMFCSPPRKKGHPLFSPTLQSHPFHLLLFSLSLSMLSPFPDTGEMLKLVLLVSFSSLLLLQGSDAVCVPRSSNLKASTRVSSQSRSFEQSLAHAPAEPSPSQADQPERISSQQESSSVNAPTKASKHSHAAHAPATGSDSSVAGLCKRTLYPEVCVSSAKPYLPASGHVTPAEMLLVQINATAAKVDGATAHANQLLASSTVTPYLKSCLETCKDMYEDMKDNFDDARKALAASDIDTVKSMISATISDASTCEDGFLEMPGAPLLMGSYDSELSKLTSNCLAFADLV